LRDRLIAEFSQILDHALLDDLRHGLRVPMRAAMRLFSTSSTKPSFLSRSAVPPMASAAISFFSCSPQDGGTAFWGNDRITLNCSMISRSQTPMQSPARSALTDHHAQHGRRQIRHLEQVARDGFALAALFEPMPGYAPGVSIRVTTGMRKRSAIIIRRSALR